MSNAFSTSDNKQTNLIIATRGSSLALWQAEWVKQRILDEYPEISVELLVVKTTGDKIQDRPLSEIGGKGLFVKELEYALLEGRADLAVHSMKDVPSTIDSSLTIACVPKRESVNDVLITNDGFSLDSIPAIFGLTKDPYIVTTANVFALMGLRQLFFLLEGLLSRLVFLSKGLSFILAFIGIKMVFEAFHGIGIEEIAGVHIPEFSLEVSLGIIVATLIVTTVASLTATRKDGSEIV